jgi:hypothetical protein
MATWLQDTTQSHALLEGHDGLAMKTRCIWAWRCSWLIVSQDSAAPEGWWMGDWVGGYLEMALRQNNLSFFAGCHHCNWGSLRRFGSWSAHFVC